MSSIGAVTACLEVVAQCVAELRGEDENKAGAGRPAHHRGNYHKTGPAAPSIVRAPAQLRSVVYI